ncbi:MAG: aminomethyltransferase [Armatimonadota bacterium]|nr:MAG: aminomethyltransferase [Armatimonadota bacterium]
MQDAQTLKLSPLDSVHAASGARMVEFAGWRLPLMFTSILQEHRAVRERAGLFDISHMAQIIVEGDGAKGWLQSLITNDVCLAPPGKGIYTFLTNERGGVVDDGFVFHLPDGRFLLVFNASREAAVLEHLRSRLSGDVCVVARLDRGALAVQGPAAAAIMQAVTPGAENLPRRGIAAVAIAGAPVWISRTGYTGEDGFELFFHAGHAESVWRALAASGESAGMALCGLGARDTLRLEMGYPLYGHELDETTSPFEIGYGWAVKLDKGVDFPGREALRREKEAGPLRTLAGLLPEGRSTPREGSRVLCGGEVVGRVTSGTFSPSLERPICLALIALDVRGGLVLEVREKQVPARQTALPFYRPARGH